MRLFSPETRLNENTFWLVCCALIIAMLTCGAFTILGLVEAVQPDWRPTYLAGLVAFTAFERLFTYHRYARLIPFSKEWAIALSTEWVVIILLTRAVVTLSHGAGAFLKEFRFWQPAFAESFMNPDFLFALLLVIITWVLAGSFAELVEEMGLRQMLIRLEAPMQESGQAPARERLLGLIMSVGTFLIVTTALVRVDFRAVFDKSGNPFIQVPVFEGGGGSTLLYFMLGLVLFSQTQFIDLQLRWHLLQVPVSVELSRRWVLYGLIFFGMLAAFSGLLPTSYSLGVLTILGYGLSIFSGVLFLVGQVLFTILFFVLSLPFILLGRKVPFAVKLPAMPQPALVPPSGAPGSAASDAWLEAAKSLTIWGVLIAILVFSIVQYARTHEQVLQVLSRLPGSKLLIAIWIWLKGIFLITRSGTAKLVKQSLARLRPRASGIPPASGFTNLRRLNPRQRVAFFYLALLRRGDEHGLARRASQTPREYAGELDAALPGVEQEIDSLTEAFVEARYSPHTVAPEQASQVRSYWERIKKALRGKLAGK